ncbi:MAG: hypothetical protein KME45_15050 [Stenomitos rutilans HA7619-LM2]|jgi:hypothetical protein|nr:hypothetical protein [Stenomitos rutilans HA7619-LM2]
MARRKKVSRVLEKAQQREASLRSISAQLDLGNGLTLTTYTSRLQDLQAQLSNYNTTLSLLDKLSDDIANTEQDVRELSEKMLMGVGIKYGKSSQEYGMAGGVPKNKRRRATSQPSSSASASPQFEMVTSTSTNGRNSETTNGSTLLQ